MQQILLGVAVVVLIVWLFLRRRGNQAEHTETTEDDSPRFEYHAVSIKFDRNACKAAQKIAGRRFLSSAAPRLPLPECDVLECNCRFAHHQDRRSSKDRRSPFAAAGFGGGTGSFEKERREKPDRRKGADPDKT